MGNPTEVPFHFDLESGLTEDGGILMQARQIALFIQARHIALIFGLAQSVKQPAQPVTQLAPKKWKGAVHVDHDGVAAGLEQGEERGCLWQMRQ